MPFRMPSIRLRRNRAIFYTSHHEAQQNLVAQSRRTIQSWSEVLMSSFSFSCPLLGSSSSPSEVVRLADPARPNSYGPTILVSLFYNYWGWKFPTDNPVLSVYLDVLTGCRRRVPHSSVTIEIGPRIRDFSQLVSRRAHNTLFR